MVWIYIVSKVPVIDNSAELYKPKLARPDSFNTCRLAFLPLFRPWPPDWTNLMAVLYMPDQIGYHTPANE